MLLILISCTINMLFAQSASEKSYLYCVEGLGMRTGSNNMVITIEYQNEKFNVLTDNFSFFSALREEHRDLTVEDIQDTALAHSKDQTIRLTSEKAMDKLNYLRFEDSEIHEVQAYFLKNSLLDSIRYFEEYQSDTVYYYYEEFSNFAKETAQKLKDSLIKINQLDKTKEKLVNDFKWGRLDSYNYNKNFLNSLTDSDKELIEKFDKMVEGHRRKLKTKYTRLKQIENNCFQKPLEKFKAVYLYVLYLNGCMSGLGCESGALEFGLLEQSNITSK